MNSSQELTSSEREELKRLREIVQENEKNKTIKITRDKIKEESRKFMQETCASLQNGVKQALADYYKDRIGETIEYIEWDLQQLQKIASEARFQLTEEFKKLSPEVQALTNKEYDWEDLGSIEYDIQTLKEMMEFLKSKQGFLE